LDEELVEVAAADPVAAVLAETEGAELALCRGIVNVAWEIPAVALPRSSSAVIRG
jgi:hypothetical protein